MGIRRKVTLVLLASFLLWSGAIEPRLVKVDRVVVEVPGLPEAFEGFTFLHLSDLHSTTFGPGQERLLGLLLKEDFDAVAFTGDMVDSSTGDSRPLVELLAGLPRQKPKYFVPGNHELSLAQEDPESWVRLEREMGSFGAEVLADRIVGIYRDGASLFIGGAVAKPGEPVDLKRLSGSTVLLCHVPFVMDQGAELGIAVVLTGHTHGGQVRIPGLGALFVPGDTFPPKYSEGLYKLKGTSMYVNPGLGTTRIGLRFNCPPRVSLVTLRAAGRD
ncbi:MAG: metallophosphoesterase [Bacillota bacterium]